MELVIIHPGHLLPVQLIQLMEVAIILLASFKILLLHMLHSCGYYFQISNSVAKPVSFYLSDAVPKLSHLNVLQLSNKRIKIIESIQPEWKKIARLLEIREESIKTIEMENPKSVYECCCAIFIKWLEGSGLKPISWNTLIDVLFRLEKDNIAKELKQNIIPLS